MRHSAHSIPNCDASVRTSRFPLPDHDVLRRVANEAVKFCIPKYLHNELLSCWQIFAANIVAANLLLHSRSRRAHHLPRFVSSRSARSKSITSRPYTTPIGSRSDDNKRLSLYTYYVTRRTRWPCQDLEGCLLVSWLSYRYVRGCSHYAHLRKFKCSASQEALWKTGVIKCGSA